MPNRLTTAAENGKNKGQSSESRHYQRVSRNGEAYGGSNKRRAAKYCRAPFVDDWIGKLKLLHPARFGNENVLPYRLHKIAQIAHGHIGLVAVNKGALGVDYNLVAALDVD